MNKEQIKSLKEALETEKIKISNKIQTEKEGFTISNEGPKDHLENVFSEREHNVLSMVSFKDKKLLEKIELALHRIDNDPEFGSCEDCGVEIGDKRMMSNPATTRCVECQELHEKEKKTKKAA